ncbi:MAG: acetate/propionate family kinase [Candidatus Spyradosoma sp.]
MANKILVANIGSTSFKFKLYEMPSERVLASGGIERIGAAEGSFKHVIGSAQEVRGTAAFSDYAAAIAFVEKILGGFGDLAAVGFKPVMAKGISGTQFMEEPVLAAMEALYTLFPAHNPPYVNAIRSFRKAFPNLPCIGTFETAFYDDLPEHNRRYPVPRDWEARYGIRRYGFHGASHRYISQRVAELRGGEKNLRVISCHLGGSSSVCCIRNGTAIDSSWGMTPQSGLPQNNRVGDFDVFAAIYLARDLNLGVDEVERVLSKESGLKGLSGLPQGDMRDLLAAAESGNADAAVAIDVFVGAIRKYVGQFLVEMNGADVISFTAGIAENNPLLREKILEGMDFAGVKLDKAANDAARGREAVISAPDSKIEVRLVPTNEELIIARNAWAKLNGTL